MAATMVQVHRREGYLLATIDRPAVYNAINDQVYLELVDVLHAAADDAAILGVLLTGAGKYFTSGADLKEAGNKLSELAKTSVDASSWTQPVGRFMAAVVNFQKLLMVAVNGNAVGIGMTLLPHCDVAVCADHVSFWVPFSKLAFVPEFGSSLLFPEILGRSLSSEVLFLGRRVSAQEALHHGLVSRVFPQAQFHDKAEALMRDLVAIPLASSTIPLFKRMTNARRPVILRICESELIELDRRVAAGHPLEALSKL